MIRGILDLGQIARYKIRVVYVCVDVVDFPFHWLWDEDQHASLCINTVWESVWPTSCSPWFSPSSPSSSSPPTLPWRPPDKTPDRRSPATWSGTPGCTTSTTSLLTTRWRTGTTPGPSPPPSLAPAPPASRRRWSLLRRDQDISANSSGSWESRPTSPSTQTTTTWTEFIWSGILCLWWADLLVKLLLWLVIWSCYFQ